MAQGSEKLKWNLFPLGTRRICRECGKELKLEDVGEHRRLYPGRRDEFLCRDCQRLHVEAMVRRTREGLGLDP